MVIARRTNSTKLNLLIERLDGLGLALSALRACGLQMQVSRQTKRTVCKAERSAGNADSSKGGGVQRAHDRRSHTIRSDLVLDLAEPHSTRGTIENAVGADRAERLEGKTPARVAAPAFRPFDQNPAGTRNATSSDTPMWSARLFGRATNGPNQLSSRWAALISMCLCASCLALASAGCVKAQPLEDAFEFEAADLDLLKRLRNPDPTFFSGLALTNRRSRTESSPDGSATVGLTFGDIDRTVAVRAAAVITSLSDSFGDSGYLAISFSRRIDAFGIPVEGTLTFSELAGWGDAVGNEQDVGFSLALTPIYQTPGNRRIPIRLSVGANAGLSDPWQDQEFSVTAMAQWTPAFSTSVALIDGRMDVGAGLRFDNLAGRNESVFVGLTAMDALNTDGFRRITLRTGFSIPIGN